MNVAHGKPVSTLYCSRSALESPAEVAVGGTLHDSLRAGQLHLRPTYLSDMKVVLTAQHQPQFRFAKLPEQIGVAAARDIALHRIGLVLEWLEIRIAADVWIIAVFKAAHFSLGLPGKRAPADASADVTNLAAHPG